MKIEAVDNMQYVMVKNIPSDFDTKFTKEYVYNKLYVSSLKVYQYW